MVKQNAIKVFEEKKVRTVWDSDKEEWYFSIVDVVAVLTDSPNPRNYWKVLKHRLVKEGNESVTNCNQLKMLSSDGKYYKTDVATTEQLFQLIRARKRGKKTFKNERDGMFYQSFSLDISYFPFYVKLYAGQKSFVYRGFSLICLWKIGI